MFGLVMAVASERLSMVAIEFVKAGSGLGPWRNELLSKSDVAGFSCITSDFHSRSCKGGVENDMALNVAGSVCAIAARQPKTDQSSTNLCIEFRRVPPLRQCFSRPRSSE